MRESEMDKTRLNVKEKEQIFEEYFVAFVVIIIE